MEQDNNVAMILTVTSLNRECWVLGRQIDQGNFGSIRRKMSGHLIGVAKDVNDFAISTLMMLEKGMPIIAHNFACCDAFLDSLTTKR